jgi:ankyrin repeat protein
VKLLVDRGADVKAKTSNGGTVLWWAKRALTEGHEVIQFLESIGAPEEGSEL